jgi:hypothetical protein
VVCYETTGEIKDLTHHDGVGFRNLATTGEEAVGILESFRTRLGLLKVAASGTEPLEAAHIRMVVDDLLIELGDDDVLRWYTEKTAELFKNAEPIPRKRPH